MYDKDKENLTMTNTARILDDRQADLLSQLKKAGAPTIARSASLDALASSSLLTKGILTAMSSWKGAVSCHDATLSTRGISSSK